MNRTPHPKCAAQRIRAYLSKDGIDLSQRKALDLVALAAGYNSWQAMSAATRDQPQPVPALSAYERLWRELVAPVTQSMAALAAALQPMLRAGLVLNGPEFTAGDEYRMSLWVTDLNAPEAGATPLQAEMALVENDETPGEFALRFVIEDESNELLWTSGANFNGQLWSTSADDLRRELENRFSAADIICAIEGHAYFTACRSV